MDYGMAGLICLAGLLAVNILASLLVAALARPFVRFITQSPPYRRANLLFALRLFPGAASATFAIIVLLPSYLLFEPEHTGEEPGSALFLMGALAMTAVIGGLWRGIASLRATSRLDEVCRRTAEPVSLVDSHLPIYRIQGLFPLVGLLGMLRPRLYLASQVLDVLTPAELRAAVAHEAGHVSAFDNLKRLLMRSTPDILTFFPQARLLERDWALASESAADARAASNGGSAALDLCTVLVKVARFGSLALPDEIAISPLGGGSDLRMRVRLLMAMSDSEAAVPDPTAPNGIWIALSILVPALLARSSDFLHAVHSLTEVTVRWLI